MEIESRLLPCGLHVVGSPPTAIEAIATLVNIAEIDRPENKPPTKGLPGILARSINRNMEEIYLNNNRVCSCAASSTASSSSCPEYTSESKEQHQDVGVMTAVPVLIA